MACNMSHRPGVAVLFHFLSCSIALYDYIGMELVEKLQTLDRNPHEAVFLPTTLYGVWLPGASSM